MTKRPTFWGLFFEETSTEKLTADFQAAVADDSVKGIVLLIDSPGGQVAGVEGLALAIFGARNKKPVFAVIDGQGDSAAYWIAAAASRVYLAGESSETGSIGVVAMHVDRSKQNEARGIAVTEVTSGKYKRIASENKPLTDEGRASLQEAVDRLADVFRGNVATFRGTSKTTIAETEGRIYFGSEAKQTGLVDGIKSLDEAVTELRAKIASNASASRYIPPAAAATPTAKIAARMETKPALPAAPVPQPSGIQDRASLARDAQDFVDSEAAHGRTVSYAEAVQFLTDDPRLDENRRIAKKAQRYVDEQADRGRFVSMSEAVRHVTNAR